MTTEFKGINEGFLGTSTKSDQSTKIALEWLADGATNHKMCQQHSDFLPTRLLDVGSDPMSTNSPSHGERPSKRDEIHDSESMVVSRDQGTDPLVYI